MCAYHRRCQLQFHESWNKSTIVPDSSIVLTKIHIFHFSEIQRHESHHYRPPWDVSHIPQSYNILILCFIIVMAAILIYLRRLRVVRSADLRKVPTMAYFMTEEDQMEEGVLVKSSNTGSIFYSWHQDKFSLLLFISVPNVQLLCI